MQLTMSRDGEMDQKVQVPAAKAGNQNAVSGTHAVEGENYLPNVVCWSVHVHHGTCAPMCTYVHPEIYINPHTC